ncbi:alpha/beta hydrolase [Labrenzia sp. VG12]|uniref:alpha/beta hydrolase n=1 Tax=Labrenzia sp. VG12 TaxID=2021862 RepID=UPI000B8C0AC2|nr:alpha/beta fold hydrolase [Labrenzia sp. VG12]ASP36190.1 alpha/beta hydrolase [Labrenzia sp. VG12]
MAEAGTGRTQPDPDLDKGASLSGKTLRFLIKVAIVIAIAYVMAAGYMYINQRGFVFVPTGDLSTPREKGLEGIAVEQATMADGTKVTVWRVAPTKAGAPTVLYLHGNSGNLSGRWKRFQQIVESGYGLYAPTYRGYAGAEGSPSETALIADALEHFDRAAETGQPIVLHGESLGTGVATAVAAQRPEADLLVLEAPYTALVDIASEQYPWLPVAFLMKDQMPTRERIGAIEAPVLILHGTEDRVIPVAHGRRLFEFAENPKELVIVEGGGHGDLWTRGLWDKVRSVWEGLDRGT